MITCLVIIFNRKPVWHLLIVYVTKIIKQKLWLSVQFVHLGFMHVHTYKHVWQRTVLRTRDPRLTRDIKLCASTESDWTTKVLHYKCFSIHFNRNIQSVKHKACVRHNNFITQFACEADGCKHSLCVSYIRTILEKNKQDVLDYWMTFGVIVRETLSRWGGKNIGCEGKIM